MKINTDSKILILILSILMKEANLVNNSSTNKNFKPICRASITNRSTCRIHKTQGDIHKTLSIRTKVDHLPT